jgi:hypothetical protein
MVSSGCELAVPALEHPLRLADAASLVVPGVGARPAGLVLRVVADRPDGGPGVDAAVGALAGDGDVLAGVAAEERPRVRAHVLADAAGVPLLVGARRGEQQQKRERGERRSRGLHELATPIGRPYHGRETASIPRASLTLRRLRAPLR